MASRDTHTRAAVLAGLGSRLPPRAVPNSELTTADTTDEWIRSRTGISQRYFASPGMATSDLAVEAGASALKSSGESSVDAVALATTTPDRPCPATAPAVAARLGLAGVAAYDVGAVCTGFVYGLATAADEEGLSARLRQRLRSLPADERHQVLVELVCEHAAAVLGHRSTQAVAKGEAFRDLGFDSLTAVELRNRLNAATGLHLPATLVFDYPSAERVADHLRAELLDEQAPVTQPVLPASGGHDEPIAVVSMGCRYPGGADSAEQLLRVVLAEDDVLSAFPTNRGWDLDGIYDPEQKSPVGRPTIAGFIHDADRFDARFFGISPREALAMDPQQRMVLEVAWETVERSGVDPTSLRGSQTGVFVGTSAHGYVTSMRGGGGADEYLLTGNTQSVVSGRVAYSLGLEGPAVSVDTACSSSLVAVHLACQSLRSGECSLALAGGVAVIGAPGVFTASSRQGGLAPDGRCKSFAASADGTGMSEGVGVVLLERLSDARRNGHRVLAVVRGSAVNQDGASNGLSAPNGPSQQRVIRQSLANAGLSTAEVDVVEAHGTGTTLGDPIEAQALLATYGQDRDQPLWLGSIKSNIGHTQAAAGVAGVIKMVQAMHHGVLPRTLHVDEPTPQVDWSAGRVELLTQTQPWPDTGRPRRAGVSSFGVSGTNAHLILEEAPAGDAAEDLVDAEVSAVPWVVSARSAAALQAQASKLSSWVVDDPGLRPIDVGMSLVTSRTVFERRAVVIGGDRGELLDGLATVARGETGAGVVRGVVGGGRLAFLFSGQGSQRLGMGRELHADLPVFAQALDAVVAELDKHLDGSLREVMWGEDEQLLTDTGYAQSALFAIEVALFRQLESGGVRPDFVGGHSIGELSAAHVAGVLPLADAALLVASRARLMRALPAGGAMMSVSGAEEDVLAALSGWTDRVGVAAVNGPGSVVVSGDEDAIAELAERWKPRWKTARLRVSHAFHSPLMEPMLAELGEVASRLRYSAPAIPVVSNVTGEIAPPELLADPRYWIRHVREPVRFADGMRHLHDAGVTTFLEIGPNRTLAGLVHDCLDGDDDVRAVSVLRKNQPETITLLTAAANLFVHGASVDWPAFLAGREARPVDLPTYAFQRESYWLSQEEVRLPAAPARPLTEASDRIPRTRQTMRVLAGLPKAEQKRALLGEVRTHAAAALGYSSPDAVDLGRTFVEQGFDSMSGVELGLRIKQTTGLPISKSALFEYDTPIALSEHLLTLLAAPDVFDEPGPEPAAPVDQLGTIEGLYRLGLSMGRNDLAKDLLSVAARFRPTFGRELVSAHVPAPVELSTGSVEPALVCVPVVGYLHYARFSKFFQDRRRVVVPGNPGFRDGELLPADAETFIDMHVEAVTKNVFGRFVLIGHSAGGTVAHVLAAHLERLGHAPLGVALIDTPWPGQQGDDAVTALSQQFLGREGFLDVNWLTSVGGYLQIMDALDPEPHGIPTLLVRASDPLEDGAHLRVEWRLKHEAVEVPGDHFTMMEDHVESTALAIETWIGDL